MRGKRIFASAVLSATAAMACGSGDGTDAGMCLPPASGEIGTWAPVTDLAEARCAPRTVWTGTEVLVRGGFECAARSEAYAPATGMMRTISDVGEPPCGQEETAVWTGVEMIVWGRAFGDSGSPVAGRYDPGTDLWRSVSLDGAPPATRAHSAVWTGSEMIVFGGWTIPTPGADEVILGTGAAYDPAADAWRTIASEGAPSPRFVHAAVWTGQEMLVWGGQQAEPPALADGAAYDPALDRWRPIASQGGPALARGQSLVWTGTAAFAFGDRVAAYDVAMDAWSDVCAPEDLAGVPSSTALWTGDAVALIGGKPESFRWDQGGVYEPVSGVWTPITPDLTASGVATWTGDRAVVLGGCVTLSSVVYELTL